ncbi:unnamed protein product [Miscanthus lutarioriparius]|uniref:Uncharacterized protein n=1 Tax=Miscanthus lutarioriparius TaxID=422564 RepID=A0A811MFR9_9POAL|nr:unnamed protein product [Miscanthus lutarioriparius]
MVTASTGVINSLLPKLTALLGEEYVKLRSVRPGISYLKDELSSMSALITKLSDVEELDVQLKEWRNNVRELDYDIEDCIDTFMHHFDSGNTKGGLIRKTTRSIKKLWARHQVATQIKELKSRVMEVSERRLRAESKGLVGMDGPREEIVKWLMDEQQQLKVVSIVGFGGLGKTTLAMEVYRTIGGQFQCKASTSVSRNLSLNKLICDLLSQVDPGEHGRLEILEVEQLVRKLRECLKDKRGNIWNLACIKYTLLEQIEPLDKIKSQRLFLRRIFLSEQSCPPQLEEVSNAILRKCSGLPLAIITIPSLLAIKPKVKDQWEMDYVITRETLIWKWIAEGFIVGGRGQNLEEVGEIYFNELINRSMIQPVDIQYDGRARACRVHDLVLDILISLSTEENFVTILDGDDPKSMTNKIRRLSMQYNETEHEVLPMVPVCTGEIHRTLLSVEVFGSQLHRYYKYPRRNRQTTKFRDTGPDILFNRRKITSNNRSIEKIGSPICLFQINAASGDHKSSGCASAIYYLLQLYKILRRSWSDDSTKKTRDKVLSLMLCRCHFPVERLVVGNQGFQCLKEFSPSKWCMEECGWCSHRELCQRSKHYVSSFMPGKQEVESFDSAIKHAVKTRPNHPMPQIVRTSVNYMADENENLEDNRVFHYILLDMKLDTSQIHVYDLKRRPLSHIKSLEDILNKYLKPVTFIFV